MLLGFRENTKLTNYNYDEFSANRYHLDAFIGPELGSKAPDFELTTADGKRKRLLDFDGDFLVLELGSITCPLFQSRRKSMAAIVRKYPNVSFSILYVREAHPGLAIPSHKNIDKKIDCALCLRSDDGEGRAILIDNIEGTAHQAYGSYPNAIFIINKMGCIVFQSDWNNPNATNRALDAVIHGKPAQVKSYFKPATPLVALRTFKRAGAGSAIDFFRSLPKLIWKNAIRRNVLLMMGRQPKIEPDVDC